KELVSPFYGDSEFSFGQLNYLKLVEIAQDFLLALESAYKYLKALMTHKQELKNGLQQSKQDKKTEEEDENINKFFSTLDLDQEPQSYLEFFPEENWFSYQIIYDILLKKPGICDESDIQRVDDARTIMQLEDYKVFMIPIKETRTTSMDWLLSVIPPNLSNIALTRSHETDFFYMYRNSGVIYLPGAPDWLLQQYALPMQLVFIIKTITSTYTSFLSKNFNKLNKLYLEFVYYYKLGQLEELREKEAALKAGMITSSIILMRAMDIRNMINAAKTFKYIDHALTLEEMLIESRQEIQLDMMETRISQLREISDGANNLFNDINARRSENIENTQNLFLMLLGIVTTGFTAIEFLQFFLSPDEYKWPIMVISVIFLGAILTLIGFMRWWSGRHLEFKEEK
ncbi:MAG: hypothetical protein EAX96_17285, partial [Candidatus Lokiarchaeota archaeon]|nr:hypothetical protein [Candidatus Lokiarchaeota archaeon]